MQEIKYKNQKAYLLTTDDLFELDRHSSSPSSEEIRHKILEARRDKVNYVFILTSLRKDSIPVWLRSQVTDKKNCFVVEI
jgi:hypothetical protein